MFDFKVNDMRLSKNFKLSEFACRDGSPEILLDMDLVQRLQKLRDQIGKAIHINSGYRNPNYNKKIGGAPRSYHMRGMAADIRVDGMSTTELARQAKIAGFDGVGIYRDFVHVDVRGYDANWAQ
jgi:uncharacterized protein YcbK (DUF882 family)